MWCSTCLDCIAWQAQVNLGLSGVLYGNTLRLLAKRRFAASCACHHYYLCMRACVHACVHGCMRLCVCVHQLFGIWSFKKQLFRIAKITIFSALVVINTNIQTSLVQEMSGSHSEVQHTRTTVVWPWKRLVTMMILLCFAWLTKLLVAGLLLLVKMGPL